MTEVLDFLCDGPSGGVARRRGTLPTGEEDQERVLDLFGGGPSGGMVARLRDAPLTGERMTRKEVLDLFL
jgi:hypothetical protein